MSPNLIHTERERTRLIVLCGLTVSFVLLTRTASAQSPPPFIIYDDGLTRTNVGNTGSQIILRDNPNPPPNPTTVILTNGFSLGPALQGLFRLEGSSVLDNRGGRLENDGGEIVDLFDTSRLLMSGGEIAATTGFGPGIRAADSSRTVISGGRLSADGDSEGSNGSVIRLTNNAQLEISGGEFIALSTPIIDARDASRVTIDGGTFRAFGGGSFFFGNILTARQSSVVDILGGTFTSNTFPNIARGIAAANNATVNIRGGTFNFFFFPFERTGFNGAGGRLNVFGGGFALDGIPVGPGRIPRDGRLTGVLADGTPLDVLAQGTVFLVPEPAAWLLAAVALVWPARRGRSWRRLGVCQKMPGEEEKRKRGRSGQN